MCPWSITRWIRPGRRLILGILISASWTGAGRAEDPLPDPAELTRRLLDRSQAVAQADPRPQYTFESHAVFEQLNADGEVVESESKVYHVEWMAGLPIKRLVQIQGRDLSPEELEKAQRQEDGFREKITSMQPRKMAANKQSVLTAKLLDRYQFQVKERILIRNRPTLVTTFKAKDTPRSWETIQDKILNRLEGTLWIDEIEADTARVDIALVEPFALGWLGILGSLTQCDFSLERQRMPDGVWINSRQKLQIQCRKLASITRFRRTEESVGFKKIEPDTKP